MYVISQVSVLVILIALGYGCAKLKIAGPDATGWLFSALILKISLPCTILISFQRPFSRELLGETGAALVASALMYGIAFPVALAFPYLLRIRGPERGGTPLRNTEFQLRVYGLSGNRGADGAGVSFSVVIHKV